MLAAISGGVLALDWWTKQWAASTLAYHEPVEVLGEFVRLTYTRNSGIAFGLGAGVRFPYYLFSILAAAIIVYLFARQRVRSLTRQTALALILGGALGNLVDRLKTGEVVDFIEVGWNGWHWPVFNVADSAVTIGVLLFAFTWSRKDEPVAEPAGGPGGHTAVAGHEGSARIVRTPTHESNAGSLGTGPEHGGATGPIPGGSSEGPLA